MDHLSDKYHRHPHKHQYEPFDRFIQILVFIIVLIIAIGAVINIL